ncbi:MAG: hypothetical protein AAGJ80_00040 [Cyanobacteria bacterium J06553_1]
MKNLLLKLALAFPLAMVTAGGAIAQNVPVAQQKSPATFEQYPYRPACRQLTAAPGGSAGWFAWGPTIDGEHQNWRGIEASVPPEQAYERLAAIGLCVIDGELVPLAAAEADENLTPMERNIAELKAKANGEATETDSSDDGFGAFMLLMLVMFGGVHLWERFEDRPWVKRVTGNGKPPGNGGSAFDHLPPSFDETTIPDRVSSEDLGDLPNSPDEPRSALQTLINTPFVSRAIFGFQRTGKTNMVAMALGQLAKLFGVHAFVINLNAYTGNGEQAVYWEGEHITAVLGDLEETTDPDEAQALINKAKSLVDDFTKHHGPAVLVVDEWSGTTASHATYADMLQPLVKRIAGRVTSLASTGVQREKAVWTIAPEMVAETMDSFGKSVKKLSVCLVAIAPGHVAKWKKTELTFSDELLAQVRRNFPAISNPPTESEHSRIAFIDGHWRQLGTKALVKVSVGNAPVEEFNEPPKLPTFTTTTDNVTGELKLFLEWLETKAGELIEYSHFRNCNKFREMGRSRDVFDSLCDKACMKGWILAESDEAYRVNL